MNNIIFPCAAVVCVVFNLMTHISAQADTFGGGDPDEFTIDFVQISNTDNAEDNTGYGAVSYEYRVGKYEISRLQITKAKELGMTYVSSSGPSDNHPEAQITWYKAAWFVNWLNTSTGHQAAYDLTYTNASYSMKLWSSEQAWTAGGTNLYRNKDAFYFLPNENEWYKAAYYNPAGSNYFDYPTGSDTAPGALRGRGETGTPGGTGADTAVYGSPDDNKGDEATDTHLASAYIYDAGGLSPYGTMAQGGNLWEWTESAYDRNNNSGSELRTLRGGGWSDVNATYLDASRRGDFDPNTAQDDLGFRVASVPEPSTYVLVLLGAGAVYIWKRRKSSL
jgi:formylglycine-generating enzyme